MAKAKASDVERLLQPEVVRELATAIPGFDRRGLLVALIDCFGGQESLARSIYAEYSAAPAGSMAKQRWGGLICQLISAESQADQQRPAEQLTEEELRASIKAFIPKVAPGVAPDG